MQRALTHVRFAVPPVGASLAGWPWWAVALLLLISYGPTWVMAWLDVMDRVRGRTPLDSKTRSKFSR
jgi:hypothetical protein